MSVSGAPDARGAKVLRLGPLAIERRAALVGLACTSAILLLRLPSLFEPPWHTDEGIFAAVATRVVNGGELYADAWESKPPLFLYLYAVIFKVFGVGVLQLHLAATASAIATQWALYSAGCRLMSRRQALAASLLAGVMLGVPFWEGNLALTEIFTVLPSTLAVVCVLKAFDVRRGQPRPAGALTNRAAIWLLLAGTLFGIAFLLRQTSAVVLVSLGLWVLLSQRAWFKTGMILGAGFLAAVVPAILAFWLAGTFRWFWDANIGFFFDYVPSGQQIPFHYRPLIVSPVVVSLLCLAWYRYRRETPAWTLPALWFVFTLAGALLTGRPYSHYFLQVIPPLALLVAMIVPHMHWSWRPRWRQAPALALALSVVALWLGVVRPEFYGNMLAMHYTKDAEYYANFAGWATGIKDRERYNRYFDRRVALTLELEKTLKQMGVEDKKLYIWGEYPWVYALTDSQPATRYVTSFYVLLIADLDTQLYQTLSEADPRFIVTVTDVWPKITDDSGVARRRLDISMRALSLLVTKNYAPVASIGKAQIFSRSFNFPSSEALNDFDESALLH